eukprot:3243-Heterococcus_DN1.PRE.1
MCVARPRLTVTEHAKRPWYTKRNASHCRTCCAFECNEMSTSNVTAAHTSLTHSYTTDHSAY